ncbi:MAG: hypothetical protein CMJ64_00985 [Planctomycetaceae bacterium]|nr:hypothetical protein [Planctomycetaceae bacterium]
MQIWKARIGRACRNVPPVDSRMARLFVVFCLSIIVSPRGLSGEEAEHWAFGPIKQVELPAVRQLDLLQTPVDSFVLRSLEAQGLSFGERADRRTLLRRLSFDLLGLPPTSEEIIAFVADDSPDAYARVVERMLSSPKYGERWGKMWLDAAGYADSNGYFNADTDRPYAYKYRDYVIRAFNNDKLYDQFLREQLAGDELAAYSPKRSVTPKTVELLTATHFLRNAQDGTSESDGNPDEVTVDRATVLEGTLQITMNTLLGITIQCVRCHEHKFEPIEHAEYYQLQSIFYPVFPFLHRDAWVGPVQRVDQVATDSEMAAWESELRQLSDEIAARREEFVEWTKANRPPSVIRFQDNFDSAEATLAENWSNQAPGDDAPGGKPPVNVDSVSAPGATIHNDALEVREVGTKGNRWLSTKAVIDWTPDKSGESVQVTFDLISDKVSVDEPPAARIGYYIALHDFDDSSSTTGGNILFDGNPAGSAGVHIDYPGDDSTTAGSIGTSGYKAGHNYGVRITNVGSDEFRVEHLVDWAPETQVVTLSAADLPDGGFGFEYCCGRSFVVDNILVESFPSSDDSQPSDEAVTAFLAASAEQRKALDAAVVVRNAHLASKPGQLAWVRDLMTPAPDIHRLERGSYSDPAETVKPAGLAVLSDGGFELPVLPDDVQSSGRRLAFANWLTQPDSRSAALLARVMVNRIWQHHFGRGLVATPDNFGQSGAEPSHPELLDYLAVEFVRSGWSVKSLHRSIVYSAAFQQSSEHREAASQADPNNRLLWCFPLRRLAAEAVRDAMLAASGELDDRLFGPYVPTTTLQDGNVVVDDGDDGARRRGIYLQQRRTKMNSLLSLFDAPEMVSTCGQRNTSTVPLQSLALLNSSFVRKRSEALARRVAGEASIAAEARVKRVFRLTFGREPEAAEKRAAVDFLQKQRAYYDTDSEQKAMIDLCQMLFASNAFLYVE